MTLQRLQFLLACTLLVASLAAAQTSDAPVVNDWPHSATVNSVIELKGFRLGSGELESAKIFVIQNEIEMPAFTTGGSGITNNSLNKPQTLQVILPEEVVPGPAQIVAERSGLRSVPVTITITEWTPPIIKRITPTSGPPGTIVGIECDNFHGSDEIELTDGEGRPVEHGGGGATNGTAFGVPKDSPEGVLRIRLGNRKFGKGQFTPPFEFMVTNEALPLEVVPEWIKAVAPGQWIDIQSSSLAPLEHSEQTEISFKQAGREIIVNAPLPQRPHFEVPAVLLPGDVEVQVRTWRHGRASSWSEPVTIQLSDKRLPPYVQGLRLEEGTWVDMSPGPDRATRFSAAPGDLVTIHGQFPVAGPDSLKVLLVRLGDVVELDVTDPYEKDQWFGDVRMKLPANIGRGNWQMILRATDGTEHVVPIPIRISAKNP